MLALMTELGGLFNMLPKGAKNAVRNRIYSYLTGTGKGDGYLDKVFDKAMRDLSPISDKEVEERMKPYRSTKIKATDALEGLLHGAGTALEGYQNVKGMESSLLGDAVLAMTGIADAPGYVNPLKAAVAPLAAGKKAKGYAQQKFGEVANDAINQAFEPLIDRVNKNLDTELMIREQPNTGYYDLTRSRESRIEKGRQKGRDRQK